MADQSSGGVTQIVVAVIGVVGVVSGALFANWDKIFPHSGAKSVAASAPVMQPPAGIDPEPVPTATSSVAAGDLSGTWHDDDGYIYAVRQQGTSFRYVQRQKGKDVGTGAGTIEGRMLRYAWEGGGNNGHCAATVTENGRAFAGTCTDGTDSWPFRVER